MAASHILISYVGAMSAAPTVVRGREDAKVLAEKLRARAAAGEDFSALAKEFSADPSKSRGGSVGNFDKGTMVGPFETATEALAVGEISPVVESPFGFHIIRRDMMSQIHCAQIVVGFAGSARPIEGVTRSKEQAAVRAAAARADLDAGVPWEVLVRKYTDGPGKDDQGDLGWFSRRQLMPVLDEAAFALAPGETSAVVESAVGFHLLHRLK
jgi:parvulin-like peptidyl-prolyl isomerase